MDTLDEPMLQPIEGRPFSWKGVIETTRRTGFANAQKQSMTCRHAVVTHEKLIGENNLQPILSLERALVLASSVALVKVERKGAATGFLVGASLLLTNNHVIRSVDEATQTTLRFNYQYDINGQLRAGETYTLNPYEVFYTNSELDFTLVSVEGNPGSKYGIIPISTNPFLMVGEGLSIIQHPMGQPKQIAMVDNEVVYIGSEVIQYLTDTLPGSSGSPVFNEKWELVGLHHSGGWIPEPSSHSTHFRNEGINIKAIIDDLLLNGLVR